tara:strand:+ start:1317 stop:1895 length:579 start_codon:yes stop_codon:yes gene_type:complete
MALRDKFMEEIPVEGLDMTPEPTADEAAMEAKMNEADAAFDETMDAANPMGDFTSGAINILIDKVNDALELFGETEEIASVEEDGEFPTELTKAISMIERAAIDSGVSDDDMGLGELQNDGDLKMLAGKVAALSKNQNLKTFLKTQGTDMNAALIVGVETEAAGSMDQAPPSPQGPPAMDEEEMSKLFNSRM